MKPPVQTNEIFYGGTGCLFLSSSSAVVLYELQQQKVLAEVASPPVKYVVWSNDGNMVALLSKHSEFCLRFQEDVVLTMWQRLLLSTRRFLRAA